jgi:hypothetical protein
LPEFAYFNLLIILFLRTALLKGARPSKIRFEPSQIGNLLLQMLYAYLSAASCQVLSQLLRGCAEN